MIPITELKQVFIVGQDKSTKENNKKLNYAYYKLFLNGNYYQLLNFLKENNVNEEIYKYFKNNKEGVINQNAIWNIGCSAEAAKFPRRVSTYEYLVSMGEISGLTHKEAKVKTSSVLKNLDLWKFKKRSPNEYSSGMKKRCY